MKQWKKKGYKVYEIPFDCELHRFVLVADEGDVIGEIVPQSINDMQQCIIDLDNGSDPIRDGWSNGLGGDCSNWIARLASI